MLKNNTRFILASELNSKRKIIRILSLPADNFLFEKVLEDKYPHLTFEFDCIERDEDVYGRGQDSLRTIQLRSKVNYYNMSTTEFLINADGRRKYDMIWLDYCGEYTSKILIDLKLCARLVTKTAVVAMTLAGRREKPHNIAPILASLDVKDRTLTNVREVGIPKITAKALSLPCAKILRYHDTLTKAHASPMYLYIFKHSDELVLPIIELTSRKIRSWSKAKLGSLII